MTPARVAASAQDAANPANTPQPAGSAPASSAPAGSTPADSNPCPTSCCCTDSCVLFGSRPTRKPRGAHPSAARNTASLRGSASPSSEAPHRETALRQGMTPARVAASAQDAANPANTPQPAGSAPASSAPAGSTPADSNPCPTSCCCTDSCVLFGSRPTRKPRGAHPSGAPLGINPAQARYSNHKLSTTIRERRCTKPRRWIGSRKPPCSRRQRKRASRLRDPSTDRS